MRRCAHSCTTTHGPSRHPTFAARRTVVTMSSNPGFVPQEYPQVYTPGGPPGETRPPYPGGGPGSSHKPPTPVTSSKSRLLLPLLRRLRPGWGSLAACTLAYLTRPQEFLMRHFMMAELYNIVQRHDLGPELKLNHNVLVRMGKKMEFFDLWLFTIGFQPDDDDREAAGIEPLVCIGFMSRFYAVFDDAMAIDSIQWEVFHRTGEAPVAPHGGGTNPASAAAESTPE